MEPTQPPTETVVKPRSRAEAFSALIRDQRIGHGAFRLWHCLRDFQNPRTGLCCPGQRRLSEDIGCDPHSLKAWTAELVTAGWLTVKQAKRGELFQYQLLDGTGEVLQKTTSPGVAEKRNTSGCCEKPQHSVAEKRNGVLRKTTTKLRGVKTPLENKLTTAASAGPALLTQQSSSAAEGNGAVSCLGRF